MLRLLSDCYTRTRVSYLFVLLYFSLSLFLSHCSFSFTYTLSPRALSHHSLPSFSPIHSLSSFSLIIFSLILSHTLSFSLTHSLAHSHAFLISISSRRHRVSSESHPWRYQLSVFRSWGLLFLLLIAALSGSLYKEPYSVFTTVSSLAIATTEKKPCRDGASCTRSNCWFVHPAERPTQADSGSTDATPCKSTFALKLLGISVLLRTMPNLRWYMVLIHLTSLTVGVVDFSFIASTELSYEIENSQPIEFLIQHLTLSFPDLRLPSCATAAGLLLCPQGPLCMDPSCQLEHSGSQPAVAPVTAATTPIPRTSSVCVTCVTMKAKKSAMIKGAKAFKLKIKSFAGEETVRILKYKLSAT